MKECILNCPRIQAAVKEAENSGGYYSLSMYAVKATGKLLEACGASYDCTTGPVVEDQQVEKGHFFNKRTETAPVNVCGLDEPRQVVQPPAANS